MANLPETARMPCFFQPQHHVAGVHTLGPGA